MGGSVGAKEVAPAPNTMDFSEFKTNGATAPSDSPAGFVDVAPDACIVFPSRYIGTAATTSAAKAKQKTKGVYSHDPILERDPDELWRFLVSNLKRPRLVVSLFGTHTETRRSTTMHKGAHRTSTHTVTVTDFSMEIDISNYVCPWSQIIARAPKSSQKTVASKDQGTPSGRTVRETLEEYTSSQNLFKEFRMAKVVFWDYQRVTELLEDLVRSTGYRHSIHVKFMTKDYKVVALASNGVSKSAHSTPVRAMCCLSCLCVVCWPAWAVARQRMKNGLSCEYKCRVNADEFFRRNSAMIRLAVTERWKQRTMVGL